MDPRPAEPAAAPHESAPPAPPRPSKKLIGTLCAFVVVLAGAGYAWFGTPQALTGNVPQAEAGGAGGHLEQIAAMIGKLEDRLKTQPDDAEGWSMLGRSYSVLGRYPEAVDAFRKVVALRAGDPPTLAQALADQADATAMAAGRRLAGEPEQLIERALQADPKNLKALALAGTIAFDRQDFTRAARLWQDAVSSAEPGSELARNLEGGIAEARARAGLPATGASGAAAPVAAASVSGRITLAAALRDRAAPEDTLFVFARAAGASAGPRPPLAILRKQVKDLPLTFTLDDSMAMNPALRLSSVRQVIVGARISKSGNAIAQPGDLQGLSAPVDVGTSGLAIEIAEPVK
ncbi:MAG: tetratricopeptide repeat protein [Piscinibacter sp.]|nr:tetratricopeptide repeat protein [Piscinibacter sp.]